MLGSNNVRHNNKNNINPYQYPYQNPNMNPNMNQNMDINNLMNQLSSLSSQLNNASNIPNHYNQYQNQNQMQDSMYVGNLRRVMGLNENSKKLTTPNNPFKLKLKPHQEALLYRVLELDDKASKSAMPFGIMSDKPGSGKTFVILAMIYYSIKFFNSRGANIIVVPHNIYTQWTNAIDIFLGKLLKYVCLTDYNEINQLYTNSQILYKNDIIITTPLMYDVFAGTVNSLGLYVRRIFFDEADSMKNILTKISLI